MKKIVVVISGPPGAGSSTVAKKVAQKLKLKYFSAGILQKRLVKGWKKGEAKAALESWKTVKGRSRKTHQERDKLMVETAKGGNIVICGKLGIHFLKDLSRYKIWLAVPLKVRAKRVAKRDKISIRQAGQEISAREKIERRSWKRIYDFDYFDQKKEADFILDSSRLAVNQTVAKIIKFIKTR